MRALIFAWVIAAASLSAAPAFATDVGPFGGPGGTPFRWTCPAGAYLIGITGRAGAWTDRIAGKCATWSAEQQTFVGSSFDGPFFGQSEGGNWFGSTCALSAIARMRSVTSDTLQDISFRCGTFAQPPVEIGNWISIYYDHGSPT